MSLIFLFFINAMASTSVAWDHQQEDMMTILEALRDFGHVKYDTESRNALSDVDKLSNLNSNSHVSTRLGLASSIVDHNLDSKSKRGWEDFSKEWRRSPKRAWDVVRRLWKVPAIRTKYISFLKNGKRSKEIHEYTPVQDDGGNPIQMFDEVGYDADDDSSMEQRRKAFVQDLFKQHIQPGTKRGWEDLNIFKARNVKRRLSAVGEKMLIMEPDYKRGWEDLLWKRNVRGQTENDEDIANIMSEIGNTQKDLLNLRPSDVDTLSERNTHDIKMFEYTDPILFRSQ